MMTQLLEMCRHVLAGYISGAKNAYRQALKHVVLTGMFLDLSAVGDHTTQLSPTAKCPSDGW
jgi:hypothetical protein